MLDLLLVLTPISLIDSTSILAFGLVVLAVLLSGPRPYLASSSFLLGTALSYFAAGVLIVMGLGGAIGRVSAALVHWWKNPSTSDYVLGILVGSALMVFGYRGSVARQRKAKQKEVAPDVTPKQAFLLGAGTTIAGLWGALPYFAAIDQILKADLSTAEAVIALAYYNVVFVALLFLLVLFRAVAGQRADALFDTVNRLLAVWGKRAVIALMLLLGAVLVADGFGFFLGRPLIPVE
ncbi:MAG: GAP family protein [Candidatus Latescibacterota bacterium]|nr:MAG: GAP family protein [Candidatus Latescibacterota bacterium]